MAWPDVPQGFQTLLTMLGSTVLVPLLLVPAMGGSTADTAKVICTCFFASGINTLLQTLLGARLPIVQGGSFAYISPVLILAASIKSDPSNTFATDQDRFVYTMRYVQGGIIGSALIALGLALFSVYLCVRRRARAALPTVEPLWPVLWRRMPRLTALIWYAPPALAWACRWMLK